MLIFKKYNAQNREIYFPRTLERTANTLRRACGRRRRYVIGADAADLLACYGRQRSGRCASVMRLTFSGFTRILVEEGHEHRQLNAGDVITKKLNRLGPSKSDRVIFLGLLYMQILQ